MIIVNDTPKAELVCVKTEDDIALHGALYEVESSPLAVVMLPGAAMNFYTGLGRFLPTRLTRAGITCLTANLRGHDFGTAPDEDKKPVIGLMRDHFADCVLDFRALVGFMRQRGYPRLVLVGHSQAVTKIVYAQGRERFPEAAGIVLVSPPPSNKEMLKFLVSQNSYERGLFRAGELAGLGKDDQLIVLVGRGTMPWAFSARTFLEFYGPDSPGDTKELVRDITCPILLVRGGQDFRPVSRRLLQTIRHNAGDPRRCGIVEVEGADHFYKGCEEQLSQVIIEWLRTV
ncbi:MAG: alpha/beta fold hydrolase [Firmicutes bacterium]|nr:alpha/beta fold hydrolase [Bacillota bacterium]